MIVIGNGEFVVFLLWFDSKVFWLKFSVWFLCVVWDKEILGVVGIVMFKVFGCLVMFFLIIWNIGMMIVLFKKINWLLKYKY